MPILFAQGAKDDLVTGPVAPRQEFYRPRDAPWTLAVDSTAGHELADLRTFSLPYLDAMLQKRLPDRNGEPLRPLDFPSGYVGDTTRGKAVPVAAFASQREAASWLPDENLARLWERYCATGQAAPAVGQAQNELPKPRDVRALRRGSSEELAPKGSEEGKPSKLGFYSS